MSRNVIEGILFIKQLKSIDVNVKFVREPALDINTPDGMNLLRIKLSQGELESDKIGLRLRNAFK